jgi:hypothetical protein
LPSREDSELMPDESYHVAIRQYSWGQCAAVLNFIVTVTPDSSQYHLIRTFQSRGI